MKSKVNGRLRLNFFIRLFVMGLAAISTIPLLAIILFIIEQGITKINWALISQVPKPVGELGGGIVHAIIGTCIIVAMGAAIAIPVGIICGIFLSQYKNAKLAFYVRTSVDVLQGLPSILTGIVVYGWIVSTLHAFSAFSGSIALAIIMAPIVIRSTEETLLLIPDLYKEAGLGLGLPLYKVIFRVIVPCGFSGIISGIMLGVARIAGETAPLIFTAYGNNYINTNIMKPTETLPTLIYNYAQAPYASLKDLAWGASFILLTFVLTLNILTKLITRKWNVQL